MAISNGLNFKAHKLTAAIFSSHSVPIEPVSTSLTVGPICVPNTPQAFSGDRVTVTGL